MAVTKTKQGADIMADQQDPQENAQNQEETYVEDVQDEQEVQQENSQEDYVANEEQTRNRNTMGNNQGVDRSNFIHGLAVGLGIGCIATFVIVWISLFFTPRLPSGVTYENMLAIFVYPLIYLLAVGLIALTAGIVREYYSTKQKF
jgi:hypothetical protein